MFTGLVQGIGSVESIRAKAGGGRQLRIALPSSFPLPKEGASVACSGVCLTARECNEGGFSADASEETLACSTLGEWQGGRAINLEPSLAAGDELGGHIVLGHVDAPVMVAGFEAQGAFRLLTVSIPLSFAPFLAAKGSLALDGVSLTLNEVRTRKDHVEAQLMLIPETLEATTLDTLEAGAKMNMELDPLARYAVRAVEALR